MSTKPRLLILTSTFPRWQNDSEPPFVFELSRRLTTAFAVTVLTPRSPGSQHQETMDDLQVIRFPYFIQRWESLASHGGGILNRLKTNRLYYLLIPFFLLGQLWATTQLLRRERFDIIHTHWLIPQGLVAILSCRIVQANIPMVCTSHGGDLYALQHPVLKRIKLWIMARSATLTVVSSAMRNHVIGLGVSPNKVQVISMGVDLQHRFTPDPKVQRDDQELLFVGRLVEKKGLSILLHAMPNILTLHPNAHLTVAGSGPLEPELRNLVQKLSLSKKVNFLGMVTQQELTALYRHAVLFIAPFIIAKDGDQEGLGLVMVEAMGCNCAVIASDLPAIRDVVEHEKTGYLVPPENPYALSQAIIHLLSDSNLRNSLSSEAQIKVQQKFSWEVIATAYKNLLITTLRPQHLSDS